MIPLSSLGLLVAGAVSAAWLAAPRPAEALTASCTAEPPTIGEALTGPVLQVLDANTVCVAKGPGRIVGFCCA
jgi:hypothetical protein